MGLNLFRPYFNNYSISVHNSQNCFYVHFFNPSVHNYMIFIYLQSLFTTQRVCLKQNDDQLPVGCQLSWQSTAPVSQRSWVQIPYGLEFFSGLISTTSLVVYITAMIVSVFVKWILALKQYISLNTTHANMCTILRMLFQPSFASIGRCQLSVKKKPCNFSANSQNFDQFLAFHQPHPYTESEYALAFCISQTE